MPVQSLDARARLARALSIHAHHQSRRSVRTSSPPRPHGWRGLGVGSMTVLPDGVHKIRVPLIDSPLGWVNSYVLRGDDGYMLVDCGWDTPDALDALRKGLDDLGIGLDAIR